MRVAHSTGNKAWARSLVRQSDGLLIRRPGVQIPSGPLFPFLKEFLFSELLFNKELCSSFISIISIIL